MNEQILLSNRDKIYTIKIGTLWIKKNLKLVTNDVEEFCKIINKDIIFKKWWNW